MKVWHWILIILIAFIVLGKMGYIHPVSGTGTMSTTSDWMDKLKSGPEISGTTIPYWVIALGVITLGFFLLSGGDKPSGPVVKKVLTQEISYQPRK